MPYGDRTDLSFGFFDIDQFKGVVAYFPANVVTLLSFVKLLAVTIRPCRCRASADHLVVSPASVPIVSAMPSPPGSL